MDSDTRATLESLPTVNVELNGQAAALLVQADGRSRDRAADGGAVARARHARTGGRGQGEGSAPGRLRPQDGTVRRHGRLARRNQGGSSDRPGPPPLPPDRPRQDQAEPAQVHLAGRDDRPARARTWSRSRCRRSTSRTSASAASSTAASARATATSATPLGRATAARTAGQGRRAAGRAHARGRGVASRSWPQILGEELQLPRIEPQGQAARSSRRRTSYTGIRRAGPESLRHFKRTFRAGAASARSRSGTYDPERPAHRPDPRGPALPLLARRRRCRSRTPSSST